MLDAAEELSADKVNDFGCGCGDYLHVAAARRLNLLNGIDAFWTCDIVQAGLANAAGLKTRLFESRDSATLAGHHDAGTRGKLDQVASDKSSLGGQAEEGF